MGPCVPTLRRTPPPSRSSWRQPRARRAVSSRLAGRPFSLGPSFLLTHPFSRGRSRKSLDCTPMTRLYTDRRPSAPFPDPSGPQPGNRSLGPLPPSHSGLPTPGEEPATCPVQAHKSHASVLPSHSFTFRLPSNTQSYRRHLQNARQPVPSSRRHCSGLSSHGRLAPGAWAASSALCLPQPP